MYNRSSKKLILILIIILIILVMVSFALINIIEEKQLEELQSIATPKLSKLIHEKDKYTYEYFDDIITKFLRYSQRANTEALMSILDKEYITENNINEQNMLEHLKQYIEPSIFETKEIYTQRIEYVQSEKGEYNYVKGILTRNEQEENVYFLIKQDYINSTFCISIIPEQTFNKIKEEKNINNSLDLNIEKNNYNELY